MGADKGNTCFVNAWDRLDGVVDKLLTRADRLLSADEYKMLPVHDKLAYARQIFELTGKNSIKAVQEVHTENDANIVGRAKLVENGSIVYSNKPSAKLLKKQKFTDLFTVYFDETTENGFGIVTASSISEEDAVEALTNLVECYLEDVINEAEEIKLAKLGKISLEQS